jgi:hypothetical protein
MTATAACILDSASNDSDKSFTVPDNRAYQVLSAAGRISTTATVGNRTPRIEFRDEDDNVIFGVTGSTTVAASQTDAAFGEATEAAASDLTIVPVLVPPGGSIRYYDSNAVDATGDDLVVRIQALVYKA